MNAELQRIARRDKKAFLSDQSKEMEESNRMRKARDLFIFRSYDHLLIRLFALMLVSIKNCL